MRRKGLLTGLAVLIASCGTDSPAPANTNEAAMSADSQGAAGQSGKPFAVEAIGDFEEPWAAAFMPGTSLLFVTEKPGRVKFVDLANGRLGSIESGLPTVDYGGQGGLGDIAFAPDWKPGQTSGGTIYLSWAEAGPDDTRGAALGRGTLICEEADSCRLEGLRVIWRQDKTTGRGHYSHRITFSPDGQHLFLTSGDRQKMEPAQDFDVNLGKVLRLTLDGQPAAGNPWADRGGRAAEFWTMGHRNLLGIDFAPDGRLWQVEMGPRHGDELNLIKPGQNYGWPVVSEGNHYDGRPIPDHRSRSEFIAPKAFWVPAISPASLLIYRGSMFPGWRGDALVPGLSGQSLSHVDIEGERVVGKTDYDMGARIREVVEGPDGAVYLLEDEREESRGRLLKLTPVRR